MASGDQLWTGLSWILLLRLLQTEAFGEQKRSRLSLSYVAELVLFSFFFAKVGRVVLFNVVVIVGAARSDFCSSSLFFYISHNSSQTKRMPYFQKVTGHLYISTEVLVLAGDSKAAVAKI